MPLGDYNSDFIFGISIYLFSISIFGTKNLNNITSVSKIVGAKTRSLKTRPMESYNLSIHYG